MGQQHYRMPCNQEETLWQLDMLYMAVQLWWYSQLAMELMDLHLIQ